MAIRRFYHPDLGDGHAQLDAEQSAHARRVLRLSVGDHVELFDGAGTTAAARVADAKRRIHVELTERRYTPRPSPRIDLAAAIPKGSRADGLVERASELGADRLIPLTTSRGVVDPRGGKLGRFERIAVASAKQCGRPWLLEIGRPIGLERLLADAEADYDLRLIADTAADADQGPREGEIVPERAERVMVLIGPEGGWTGAERKAARNAGFSPWRLGPYVMRVGTAAAAALAILRQRT